MHPHFIEGAIFEEIGRLIKDSMVRFLNEVSGEKKSSMRLI